MEEKKIVFKSIDEQLAEDERRESAKVDASRRSPGKAVEKAVTGTKSSNGPRKGRGKLRLKKSVRRTIGSLMLATSVVVAAVPVGGVSADSSGNYQGSKVADSDNIELDGALGTTDKVSDDTTTTTVPTTGADHFGGFPILREEILGGKKYYVIADDDNNNGYNGEPRPIYSLNKTKLNVEYYFEDNNGDEYVPPSGKLNLNIGYIESKTQGEKEQWTDDGKLYISTVIEYELYENDVNETTPGGKYTDKLYGKVINVYTEETKYTVRFLNDDGTEFSKTSVYQGDTVSKPATDPISPGKNFKGWNFDFDQPIGADIDITPVFEPTTSPKAGAVEPLPSESEPVDDDDTISGEEFVENSEDDIISSEIETANEENTETPVSENSQLDNNNESLPDSGESITDIVEEHHDTDIADASGFGLTGILLSQEYPAGSGTKYKDDPSQTIYVCDKNTNVTKICDSAFAGTRNINTVEFPANITHIGISSFEGCTSINTLSLGDGLESIGSSSFRDCASLSSVSYSDLSPLKTIGAKAFANSGLSTMSSGGSGVSIPKNVSVIGSAAFYGTPLNELSFSNLVVPCIVGNCAFARCNSLNKADLNSGNSIKISNLNSVEYLFAECENLTEAIIPKGFNDTLKYGTFASCGKFNHITFQDGLGTFANGEFDKYLITVEGPAPTSTTNNYLNPSSNSSKSYESSLDTNNDYVYRYYVGDAMHEVTNHAAYSHDDDFFESKDETKKSQEYIFDVDRNSSRLSGYYCREAIVGGRDLEIDNNIGSRADGDIILLGVDDNVFKDDHTIQYLQIDSNINYVGVSSFESTDIVKMWANVNGTQFCDNSFYNNDNLKRVTFAYGGESGSSLGSSSFGETPALENVDFYDDNLNTGDKDKYARFFMGSIHDNAFRTEGRLKEIIFKGPMQKEYAPYEFAINPSSQISNNEVYVKYYSGNPWNLTAQYKVQPFTRVSRNLETGVEKTIVSFQPGEGAVCLLNYPNMSSYVDIDDIDNGDSTGTIQVEDLTSMSTRTNMMSDCIKYTNNVVIPYGIEYIDIAKTKRNDYTAGDEYLVFDDSTDLYYKTGDINPDTGLADARYYRGFRYNPDLVSVTFDEGGVNSFPDRMFECTLNLKRVEFKGDVVNIGNLPFYTPDTEGDGTKYTDYNDSFDHRGPGGKSTADKDRRSHLEEIVFSALEGSSGTKDNEVYSVSGGIIKGNNGSRTQVVQIAPSRGDIVHPHDPDDEEQYNEYCFGSPYITSDELSGVNEYAAFAARDCDALESVSFPSDGCDISYGCFMDCDKLEKVVMPNKLVAVKNKAFGDISTPLTIRFPYDVANIADNAFESAADNGLSYPSVTIEAHEGAEYYQDVKNKTKNIKRIDPIPPEVDITFNGGEDTSFNPVTITSDSDDKYPTGSTYLKQLKDLPKVNGKTPVDWYGDEKQPDKTTRRVSLDDYLSYETNFYPVFDTTTTYCIYIFYPSDVFGGILYGTIELEDDEDFTIEMKEQQEKGIPKTLSDGRTYATINGLPSYNKPLTKDWNATIAYVGGSSTSTTSSTGGGTTSGGSTSGSSTSRSSSSSSSSRSSSSSSSSTALPVFVNSQDAGAAAPVSAAGVNSTVYVGEGSGSGSTGSGSGSGNGRGSGNTTVISTAGGITDTGKISATVNGSSDNYVVKITQTQEADDAGLSALHGKYGDDISAIRYLPFDISLYDSTGTNKISPVPEGVSVSITMPIPDDLAIYGGNAKIASTAGGVLEPMTPRFTVINGVPCMTYTCTHFSPYMVWVDTANLTEAGIMDATPKTADGIHPKWFLCFGLAAIAVVMFLKKDPEEYLKKKAA
ncbi:MAG: hypothetical protein E7298_06625 [Lachnospiraceae bacterium]|nr:hypothetical protein [Lachnospiraceae bacterium]